MTQIFNNLGYLETQYLTEGNYLSSNFATSANPLQFRANIVSGQHRAGIQVKNEISSDEYIGVQWLQKIQDTEFIKGLQLKVYFENQNISGLQTHINQTQVKSLATQWVFELKTSKSLAFEFFVLQNQPDALSVQFEKIFTDFSDIYGIETKFSKSLTHRITGAYLNEEPYLSEYNYLAPSFDVLMGTQFKAVQLGEKKNALQTKYKFNNQEKTSAIQFRNYVTQNNPASGIQFLNFLTQPKKSALQLEKRFVGKERFLGSEFESKVSKDRVYGLQFTSVFQKIFATQFKVSLYNTSNLRVLLDFPSRGVDGINWTSTSTAPSSSNSFSQNNLNTDIVEQYWRSEDGVTSVTLTCDTQLAQGVYTDTVALLNHNLSGSATIRLEASNDSFNTIPFATSIRVEPVNCYYIAPTLPTNSYQYWRFIIQDPGSSDGFLRVGTIVFGSAIIFTNESFVDRVRYGKQQFVDKVYTEGFSNVSNDRGKKAFLELEFRSILYGRQNYYNLSEIFRVAGVILKALWIPVPLQASRFALFGKLDQLPSEEHNYKGADADFVDYQIRVDESL